MPTPAGQVAGVRYAMHAQPGRVVAGDLFGFTEISEGRTAFFLGDVAGKGAAAGMLMAVIQASLLPQAAQFSGVAISSYFRPSNFLAGDTFDVLQQADGNIIVFQIDVAGHGAAAALVSVASQYTVAQAILQRQPGSSAADLVEQINREWPGELPFFTLLLAEINPEQGHGTLVQAGHPSPVLLTAQGKMQILGNGGLPVGVIGDATYETIPFRFQPGDRLLIATDGAHELANADGEIFSEERLYEVLGTCALHPTGQILTILDEALRGWRGDDTLDDDVTIVVLEGRTRHGDDRGAEGGTADFAAAGRTT